MESERTPHRRTVILVVCVAVLLAGCGGESPRARPIDPPRPASGAGDDAPVVASERGGLVVDVAGAVREPGVYRMPVGARVHEAIEAAGGLQPAADTSTLNRAAPVVDGQQVLVPVRGSDVTSSSGPAGTGIDGPGAGGRVSINAADEGELDELPGIGPVTAQRIVAERTSGGPFATLDDLDRVPGIGPATIEALREVASA